MQKQWTFDQVEKIYQQPIIDLVYEAQTIHRQHFNSHEVEPCVLLSIKTGACPEDCKYCSQSGHYKTELEKEKLMDKSDVVQKAKEAKAKGAKRFCMGAAWRSPPKKAIENLQAIIKEVKELGLETCMTLGMLNQEQADQLKNAGLDYYNHNLDTAREYYPEVITTRTYQERLDTLSCVAKAGLKTCCGGILGLGETQKDRINFLIELSRLDNVPESIPINNLIPVAGTPFGDKKPLDPIETVRTIATARILFPTSMIRLSAGRKHMTDEMHAMCFMAGANSLFLGDTLLTAENAGQDRDTQMFDKLGMRLEAC